MKRAIIQVRLSMEMLILIAGSARDSWKCHENFPRLRNAARRDIVEPHGTISFLKPAKSKKMSSRFLGESGILIFLYVNNLKLKEVT